MFLITVYVSHGKISAAASQYRLVVAFANMEREYHSKHGGSDIVLNARFEFPCPSAALLAASASSSSSSGGIVISVFEHNRLLNVFTSPVVCGTVTVRLPGEFSNIDRFNALPTNEAVTLVPAGDCALHSAGAGAAPGGDSLQVAVMCTKVTDQADASTLRYKAALGMVTLRLKELVNPFSDATATPAEASSPLTPFFSALKGAVQSVGEAVVSSAFFVEVSHGLAQYRSRTVKPTPTSTKSGDMMIVLFEEDIRFWVYDDTKDYQIQLQIFQLPTSLISSVGGSPTPKLVASTFLEIGSLMKRSEEQQQEVFELAVSSNSDVRITDKDSATINTNIKGAQQKDLHQQQRCLRLRATYQIKADVEENFLDGLWSHFDMDKNGTLDDTEVHALMDTIRSNMSDDEIRSFIRKVDANYDGVLTREEFTALFNSVDFQSSALASQMLAFILDGIEGLDHMITGIGEKVSMMEKKSGKHVATINTGSGVDADDMGLIIFDRLTGLVLHENIPNYIRVALKSMYRSGIGQLFTDTSAVRKLLVWQSRQEGEKMNHPDSRAKIRPFIADYGLNEDEFKIPIDQYPHFNAFFYRQLRDGVRPVASPNDPRVVVSCADSRMTVFSNIMDATPVWIKGSRFTVENLLGPRADLVPSFLGCSMVIARLAPQDYHRFHFPVAGKVRSITEIDGGLYTVNPIAVRKPFNIYTENIRHILELDTVEYGTVLMIAVGATLVGSVNVLPEYKPSTSPSSSSRSFVKGAEAGYFAFGGSTVIMLFRRGTVQWDTDLIENSKKPMEVLVRVGMQIGVATASR